MSKYHLHKSYLSKVKSIIFVGMTICVFLISNKLFAMESVEPMRVDTFIEIMGKSSCPVLMDAFSQENEFPLHYLINKKKFDALKIILQEISHLLNSEISPELREMLFFIVNKHRFCGENILEILQIKHPDKIELIRLLIKIGAHITIRLTQEEKNMPDKANSLISIRSRILNMQQRFPENGIILDLSFFFGLNKIPSWLFEGVTNIIVLNLAGNQLNEKSIRHVCKLINLQELDLYGNMLTDLPSEFENFANLKRLSISYNRLEIFPIVITKLVNLQFLNLSHSYLKMIPIEIKDLTNLQIFCLSRDSLTEEAIKNICQLSNLQVLDIAENNLTFLPVEIENLVNLETLCLSRNPLESSVLEFIYQCRFPNLQKLFLFECSRELEFGSIIDQFREQGVEVLV